MKAWSVKASSYVLENDWIKVRSDDCLTEGGHEIKPFFVLEYSDWVNVVAITRDRDVVLVRQYRHGLGETTLGLPAGVLEKADADPVAGAARELLEETGYCSDDMRLVATLSPNAATHSNRIHVVVARDAYLVQEPTQDPTEEIEVVLATIGDATRQALDGRMMQVAHVAAIILGLTAADAFTATGRELQRDEA
jgi:8-oxo-dGDP phosphatase